MGHTVEHKMQRDVGVESEIISLPGLGARIRKVDYRAADSQGHSIQFVQAIEKRA